MIRYENRTLELFIPVKELSKSVQYMHTGLECRRCVRQCHRLNGSLAIRPYFVTELVFVAAASLEP